MLIISLLLTAVPHFSKTFLLSDLIYRVCKSLIRCCDNIFNIFSCTCAKVCCPLLRLLGHIGSGCSRLLNNLGSLCASLLKNIGCVFFRLLCDFVLGNDNLCLISCLSDNILRGCLCGVKDILSLGSNFFLLS